MLPSYSIQGTWENNFDRSVNKIRFYQGQAFQIFRLITCCCDLRSRNQLPARHAAGVVVVNNVLVPSAIAKTANLCTESNWMDNTSEDLV